jgi:hypothetical protein
MEHLHETEADIIGGRIIYQHLGETPEKSVRRCDREFENRVLLNRYLMSVCYQKKLETDLAVPTLHSIVLGKTTVFKDLLFDASYRDREETEIALRAGGKGYKIVLCPHTTCFHLPRDRGKGGGWGPSLIRQQRRVMAHNEKLIRTHYPVLKNWGMKGNKWTFRAAHLLNRLRIIYRYYRYATKAFQQVGVAIVARDLRASGPGTPRVEQFLAHMSKEIFSPMLVYTNPKGTCPPLSNGVRTISMTISDELVDSMLGQSNGRQSRSSRVVLGAWMSAVRLASILIKNRISILHPQDPSSSLIAAKAQRLTGVRVIPSLKTSDEWTPQIPAPTAAQVEKFEQNVTRIFEDIYMDNARQLDKNHNLVGVDSLSDFPN